MAAKESTLKKINYRVFAVILIITAGVSVMLKLNKNFDFKVNVPLKFKDLPKDKLLKSYSADKVQVTGIASGYAYYKYKFYDQDYSIDLSKIKRKDSLTYYYSFNKEKDPLKGSLENSVVMGFKPDTVFFELDQNFEKKVPVRSRIDVAFSAGYGSLEGLVISPDSALVRGPKSSVDTIKAVYTGDENLKDIKSGFRDSTDLEPLLPIDQLEIVPKQVKYKLKVDKFTEGSLTVPLQLVNVPQGVSARVFPKRVNLVFNVNIKNYEGIKASDFKVICDFKDIDSTSTTISPKIIDRPQDVRDVRLMEKTVQYLFVK